jgi:hypothetical protein
VPLIVLYLDGRSGQHVVLHVEVEFKRKQEQLLLQHQMEEQLVQHYRNHNHVIHKHVQMVQHVVRLHNVQVDIVLEEYVILVHQLIVQRMNNMNFGHLANVMEASTIIVVSYVLVQTVEIQIVRVIQAIM